MNIENYHSDTTALTRTMLKTFSESREDYYHQYVACDIDRPQPSTPMLRGQLIHAVLLEGKTFDDAIAIYPADCLTSNGSLHPTKARAFRIQNADKICMKEHEADGLVEMTEAIAKTELAALIALAHHREQTFDGLYGTRLIKCKPDFVGMMDDRVVVYDLKCVDVRNPKQMERNARRLAYWMQDAHYTAIVQQHFVQPVVFRFVAVETCKPYRIDWYAYDPRSRELAMEKWKLLMDDFIECERTGEFLDSHHHELTLDAWELGTDDEGELVEIGDPE